MIALRVPIQLAIRGRSDSRSPARYHPEDKAHEISLSKLAVRSADCPPTKFPSPLGLQWKKWGRYRQAQKVAFVTNNASDFWTIAQKGTEKAAAELQGSMSSSRSTPMALQLNNNASSMTSLQKEPTASPSVPSIPPISSPCSTELRNSARHHSG
jgi:hypothetical protein